MVYFKCIGNVFDVFERDCSVQRRHQKIIEEAPSCLEDNLSKQIREKARIAAQAVGYENAGTVEFLLNKETHDFYFMEMNTRLQVEHPVSEMVSGLDLVELQLRVANGENISDVFENIKYSNGHAIEARICAEDWKNGFLPQFGKLENFYFQNNKVDNLRKNTANYEWTNISRKKNKNNQKDKIRIDLGFAEGSEVSQYYDSMIGKLIVWSQDRKSCINLLENALDSLRIEGIETNVPFIRGVLKQDKFTSGEYSLDFFKEVSEEVIERQSKNPLLDNINIGAFIVEFLSLDRKNLTNFRVNLPLKKILKIESKRAFGNDDNPLEREVEILEINKDNKEYKIKEKKENGEENEFTIKIVEKIESKENSIYLIEVDNKIQKQISLIRKNENKILFFKEGQFWSIDDCTLLKKIGKIDQKVEKEIIKSPMSGIVSKILVKNNQLMKKGDPILSIEAMKMEHKVVCPFDLEIDQLCCEEKSFVDSGEIIVKIKEL